VSRADGAPETTMSPLDGPAFLTEAVWVARIARFAGRAVLRRRRLALLVFVATVVLSIVFLQLVPKLYMVESRILTFQSLLLPALISPRRAVPQGHDNPTRGAVEMLKSRQSLTAIVDDADLVGTWSETRGLVGKLKDSVRATLLGPPDSDDLRMALVELLDDRFIVYVEGDVLVTRIEWHDPNVALRVAEAANRRFLDMKRESDLSEVRETLTILEARVRDTQNEVDRARNAFDAVAKKSSGRGEGGAIPMRTIQVKRAPPPEDAVTVTHRETLERELEQLSREIQRVDQAHQRRADEARATLTKLRESLGPGHPDIQEAVRVVEERTVPPDELLRYRAKESELKGEIAKLTGSPREEVVETIRVPDRSAMSSATELSMNPELTTAEEDLRDRILRHNEALTRLEMAQTELVTARASFNYRYMITQPPLLPKRHIKPKVPVVIGGGIMGGLVLALLAALIADLLSRRVVESWQIEVEAGIPVLGLVRVGDPGLARRGDA